MSTTPDLPQHSWIWRKVVFPLLMLMRQGASPEKLAWSLAIGIAIGINPLLGSTTIASLLITYLLRLNLVAVQLANHIVYPLELLLVIPFIRIGEHLFHGDRMPVTPEMLLHMARKAPWETTKLLWQWEWHALVIWAAISIVLIPFTALALTPILHHLTETALRHRKASTQE
ncbi:MAG: DUF2062 domain-containing protein [Acidobacteriaceae bacterium]